MLKKFLCFTLLCSMVFGLSPYGDTPIQPYATNNGVVTSYVFTAEIGTTYPDGA